MSDFDPVRWQNIKDLTKRLNIINILINTLNEQVNGQQFIEELKPIRDVLLAEFDSTLKALIDLVDVDDS
ncbi:MAG TPA: hypothetical protein V6D31_04560 [Candidatus Sericytochromatia bacterium]|jgi:hypothetical protein